MCASVRTFFVLIFYGGAHRAGLSWSFLLGGSTNPVQLATPRLTPMVGDYSLYQEDALIPEPIQILHIDELANQVQAQLEAWSMFLDHLSYTLPE